jgi:hypothetical protein
MPKGLFLLRSLLISEYITMLRMSGLLFAVFILLLHRDFARAVDRYEVLVEHAVPSLTGTSP